MDNPIRQARFADDRWYPSDPATLEQTIDQYLAIQSTPQNALGLVAPHAGYFYSGKVAGAVYGSVKIPDRVVVIGPNHRGVGARRSIMTHGTWQIPGHNIPIDSAFAQKFLEQAPGFSNDPHAHSMEHSLEIQLPFLRRRNPQMKLVPICLWPQQLDDCEQIGLALAKTIQDHSEPTLIVASSDMNHFESAQIGNAKDQMAIQEIIALNPHRLFDTVRQNDISMCGMVPTTIMLFATLALGAVQASLVKYADSGDASGDKNSVVGYAGLSVS